MAEIPEKESTVTVECPCCGAQLDVDAVRGVVVGKTDPAAAARKAAELKDAGRVLAEASSRIEDKYRRIVEADKGRGAAMDQLFRSFMEKAKDGPVEKPLRDIDLD